MSFDSIIQQVNDPHATRNLVTVLVVAALILGITLYFIWRVLRK